MKSNPEIFIAGGSGFIGRGLLREIIHRKIPFRIFLRKNSLNKINDIISFASSQNVDFEIVNGDVTDIESLKNAMRDCSSVISAVGIIREYPSKNITYENLHIKAVQNLIDEASKTGIKRFIHISALGARENAQTRYHASKYQAEQLIKLSTLNYTIFRPSIVYGKEDKFINMLAGFIFPYLPIIVPGSGESLFQPIWIDDLAYAVVENLFHEDSAGKIYEAGGPEKLSLNDLITLIAKSKKISDPFLLHVPSNIMKIIIAIGEKFNFFPITSEQFKMLRENNLCDEKEFLMLLSKVPMIIKRYLTEGQ